MKILFDHQAFSNQQYGGISRYFANLNQGLQQTPGVTAKLGLLFTNNAYLANEWLPFNKLVEKKHRRDKYNKWYCRYLLKQGKYDVFHPTYYNPYFLKYVKKPFVITVHDMIHELYPHYFATADPLTAGYKARVIAAADHIIAISENTKRDIQRFYPIADDKITVIHHGYKMNQTVLPATEVFTGGKFLLYVGDRFGYKNFDIFIKAVAPLLLTHQLKLICTGGGSFSEAEERMIENEKITALTTQISAMDSEMSWLYANAEAFIYPSLYEGFGLPVLEAFYNNCPVIMSNTSSLPEVGGDAVYYFDPASEQSMRNAIEEVISNKHLQNELKLKGSERLKLFDFDVTLAKTINVYQHVMR